MRLEEKLLAVVFIRRHPSHPHPAPHRAALLFAAHTAAEHPVLAGRWPSSLLQVLDVCDLDDRTHLTRGSHVRSSNQQAPYAGSLSLILRLEIHRLVFRSFQRANYPT